MSALHFVTQLLCSFTRQPSTDTLNSQLSSASWPYLAFKAPLYLLFSFVDLFEFTSPLITKIAFVRTFLNLPFSFCL